MRDATKVSIDKEENKIAVYSSDGELLFDGTRLECFLLYITLHQVLKDTFDMAGRG